MTIRTPRPEKHYGRARKFWLLYSQSLEVPEEIIEGISELGLDVSPDWISPGCVSPATCKAVQQIVDDVRSEEFNIFVL